MIIMNFSEGPLQNRIRILVTGERRVKDSGFTGIMKYQDENNKKIYELFKAILKNKPETMSSMQSTRNNTDPRAGITNVFRIQREGYPIGRLYNMMKGAGHGDEGNYGNNVHLYWFQADNKAILPMGTVAIGTEAKDENVKKKMRTEELEHLKECIESKKEILDALNEAVMIRKTELQSFKEAPKGEDSFKDE